MEKKWILITIALILAIAGAAVVGPWLLDYFNAGAILSQAGQTDLSRTETQVTEKIHRLIETTKSEPDVAENWGKLGENLYIHSFKQAALPCFKKAHEMADQDFRWIYFYAVTLDEINDNAAIEWYKKSRLLKPDYPPLLIKMGNRYLLYGQNDQAAECFAAILNSGIRVPHAHLGLARIAMDKGDLKEAERQLDTALKMAPMYREARALRADVYRRMGDKEKAEAEFGNLAGLEDRLDLADPVYYEMVEEGISSFWCQVRGNNYLKKGELNKAEEEFKKALEYQPNEASHTSLGYVYQRQKRYEAAMDHYEQALALSPDHLGALNNMAVIYYDLGDLDQAEQVIDRALKIDPESAESWLNHGTFAKKRKNYHEAAESFQKGMNLAPGDMRFVYQLGWLRAAAPLASVRSSKEAVRLAELINEKTGPGNPAAMDLLAAALAEAGRFEDADNTARQAYIFAMRGRDRALQEGIRARGVLYKNRRPYREN